MELIQTISINANQPTKFQLNQKIDKEKVAYLKTVNQSKNTHKIRIESLLSHKKEKRKLGKMKVRYKEDNKVPFSKENLINFDSSTSFDNTKRKNV